MDQSAVTRLTLNSCQNYRSRVPKCKLSAEEAAHRGSTRSFSADISLYKSGMEGEKKKDPVETTTESVSLLLRVVPKVLQLCMTAAGARGLQTVISIRVQPTEDLLTY